MLSIRKVHTDRRNCCWLLLRRGTSTYAVRQGQGCCDALYGKNRVLGRRGGKGRKSGKRELPSEFLWATGNEKICELVKECYDNFSPLALHETAMDLYKTYLVVGGMPRAVSEYARLPGAGGENAGKGAACP